MPATPTRRLPLDTGIPAPSLHPVASPVDTYIKPGPVDQLDQLSAALSQLSPAVQRFGGVVGQIQDEKALAEGRQAAEDLREAGETYASAVRKGLIPEHRSPFFMAGLKESLGTNLADGYGDALRVALAEDEDLADSTSLDEFDTKVRAFRTLWAEQNIGESGLTDSHFANGYKFRAATYEQQFRSVFANGIGAKVAKLAGEATHQAVVAGIRDGIRNGLSAEQTADDLQQEIELWIKMGRNAGSTMQAVALAVHDAAIEDPLHSEDILSLLDHIQNKNGSLGTTSFGMKLREAARLQAASAMQSEFQRDKALKAQQTTEQEDGILRQLASDLDNANGKPLDLEPYKRAMASVSPEKIGRVNDIAAAWIKPESAEDPHVLADLTVRANTIASGKPGAVTVAELANALRDGLITPASFRQLSADMTTREKTVMTDPLFEKGYSSIGKLFATEFEDNQVNRLKAESAQVEFASRYIRRFQSDPTADDQVKLRFIDQTIASIFGGFGGDDLRAFEKVPRPNLTGGPRRPDVSKVLVLTPAQLSALAGQLGDVIQRKRARLSDDLIHVLSTYGIAPDVTSIQTFLIAQKQLQQAGHRLPVDDTP